MAIPFEVTPRGEPPRSLFAKLRVRHERLVIGGATLVALLAVWQAFVGSGLVDPLFISAPTRIVQAGWSLLHGPDFWRDIAVSSNEFLLGYGAAVAIGVPLGLAIGLSRRLQYM